MQTGGKIMDADDYSHKCKFCGAKPFSPGPQHEADCERWKAKLDLDSSAAHEYQCRHCEVKPFVQGPHHAKDCPRFEREEPFVNEEIARILAHCYKSQYSTQPAPKALSVYNPLSDATRLQDVLGQDVAYLRLGRVRSALGHDMGYISAAGKIKDSFGNELGYVDSIGMVRDLFGNLQGRLR
jgi:hypothetical protein